MYFYIIWFPVVPDFDQTSGFSFLELMSYEKDLLRAEIVGIIKDYDIPSSDFRPLGIHESWDKIEESIYRTFCQLDHPISRPIWLWEHFKLDTANLVSTYSYTHLDRLIDEKEEVWFFLNGYKDKFWFYEGKIKAIQKVIAESSHIDELYIASKKYEWLISINHHDCLSTTGRLMPEKLRQIISEQAGTA